MGNVIYLLGAGASAGAIPIVSDMGTQINSDINIIQERCSALSTKFRDDAFNGYRHQVKAILQPLLEACKNFYSIDTYAKKLFLTNKSLFNAFKIDLSFYFTLRQILNSPDKRYDNFWASVLNLDTIPPDNIRVISWNYDFQLELSYINMSDHENLLSAKRALDIHYPTELEKKAGFSTMKLNGSASVFNSRHHESTYFCHVAPGVPFEKMIKNLIDAYQNIKGNPVYRSELKFAWETELRPEVMEDFLDNFNTIVIIGYSFPFFNRTIDQLIFTSGKFSNIYIQDPNPEEIKDRLSQIISLEDKKLNLLKHTGQFVFPKEL